MRALSNQEVRENALRGNSPLRDVRTSCIVAEVSNPIFEREASRRTPMKDAKFERTLRVLRAEITWPDLHARLSALERGRSE